MNCFCPLWSSRAGPKEGDKLCRLHRVLGQAQCQREDRVLPGPAAVQMLLQNTPPFHLRQHQLQDSICHQSEQLQIFGHYLLITIISPKLKIRGKKQPSVYTGWSAWSSHFAHESDGKVQTDQRKMWLFYLFDCSQISGIIPVFILFISRISLTQWLVLYVGRKQFVNSKQEIASNVFPFCWCLKTFRWRVIVLCYWIVVWHPGMVTTVSLLAIGHFSSHCPRNGEEYLLSWLSCSLMWFDICLCSQIKTISHEKSSILILLPMHI